MDGLMLKDGESVADLYGEDFIEQMKESAQENGGGWRVPFPGESRDKRHEPQPLKTCIQELQAENPAGLSVPRGFIACTERGDDSHYMAIGTSAEYARSQGWEYYDLPTSHNPNETMPKETAELLHHIATSGRHSRG